MHRLRGNDVFLQTGNDVMVISPPGAPYIIFDDGFWKGDPRFIFMLDWHIMPIFNRLRVIRLFQAGWDFPTAGEICEIFGENDHQKVKSPKNNCLEGTTLHQTAYLSYFAWKSVHGFELYEWLGIKKNKKNKRYATPIFLHHVGAPPLIRSNQTQQG